MKESRLPSGCGVFEEVADELIHWWRQNGR
jgi:hypothetical protein